MTRRFSFCAIVFLVVLTSVSGCRSGEEPERLFAEAEDLRLEYEHDASHEAIARYQRAMRAWRDAGDERHAALAARQIGATYEQLGSLHESLLGYQAALSLAEATADPLLESEIRSALGIAASLTAESEAQFQDALGQCEAALALARQSGGEREQAMAFRCHGEVEYAGGKLEQALTFYRQAYLKWDELHDVNGRAEAVAAQGTVYSDLGDLDNAARCYEEARSLLGSIGDRRQRAILQVAEARLEARRGDSQSALNGYDAALALIGPMGDAVWQGSAFAGIATVYRDMAATGPALEYWERALERFETAGLKLVSVDILMSLGTTYLLAGDAARALNRFERALSLADALGNPRWRAFALRHIGVVHLFRHAPAAARTYLEQSLDVQKSLADRRLKARTLAELGEADNLSGEYQAAIGRFAEALTLGTQATDRVSQAQALFGLARASLGRNDLDSAREYIERSMKVTDSIRTAVERRDLRASYVASVYRFNEFQMDLLMQIDALRPRQGLAAEAFEASERGRARSLLESLADAQVDLRADVDSDLLEREQALNRQFDEWAERQRSSTAGPGSVEPRAALAKEYRELEDRHNQIQAEMRSKSPRYAALTEPQPLSLAQVQAQVLDADALLLEYALGDERSYLWAVSATGQSSFMLPPRAEIEQAAGRAHDLLTKRLTATGDLADRQRRVAEADAEYWTEAARLSDMLLGPVESMLGDQRLLVVADGALQYLPFAALPIPGRAGEPVPMVAEHEIVHLPSASVLAVVRRETADRPIPTHSVAVLADPVFEPDDPRLQDGTGNASQPRRPSGIFAFLRDGQGGVPPRLAATRREARAILDMAPDGKEWTGVDASRVTALSPDLAEYRIVHFATHGVVDNENPGLSGVLLSMFDAEGQPQDGFLRLRDIYSLNLPAELVVLSACNTALGKQVRGEGLVGIVRGFMYAGAKRVVASLWKVDDEATGELMTRFYRQMLQAGQSPAAALRQAQREMWRQPRWQPPFYWAPFVLQGEWR